MVIAQIIAIIIPLTSPRGTNNNGVQGFYSHLDDKMKMYVVRDLMALESICQSPAFVT